VRQAELVDEALQALRLFQRIQVFALDVLDECHRGGRLVGHVAHQHRHAVQPGQARRAKAPFAGNDFVLARVCPCAEAAHQDRLHDALRLDAFGQLVHMPGTMSSSLSEAGCPGLAGAAASSSIFGPSSASRPRPRPLGFLVTMGMQ